MKPFFILLAGCFFWVYCAKDLLVYPQLETQVNLAPPDSVIVSTSIQNLDPGIDLTEAGYIWSFSAQTPTHAGGYDGAYVLRKPAFSNAFSMAKGGFPLNKPIYFRGYVLVNNRDTVYGPPKRTTTGHIEISATSIAADGKLTVISTFNGLSTGYGVRGYGHLWVPVGTGVPTLPTLTTPGVSFSAHQGVLASNQFAEALTALAPGTPYYVRAYAFYRDDTLYSNLLEARTGNVCQRI